MDVFEEIKGWKKQGRPVAVATNVKKEGSSLRPLGAKMAMTNAHDITGSVTGGCIEGAVYEEAQNVIKSGFPKLLHYGVPSEETPWEVGLTCGGTLDVLLESLDSAAWREIYPVLQSNLEEHNLVTLATVISGHNFGNKMMLWPDGRVLGSLGNAELDSQAIGWIKKQMAEQEPNWNIFSKADEQVSVFADVFVPPARLIVIGAVHIAIPLVTLAKDMGYHTIVVDPRTAFATPERFSHVDDLIVEWPSTALERLKPDAGTYIAVISHDEKLDNPALKVALASPARYVGVLGARKKISHRLSTLKEMGVTEDQLNHLHAPIGININAVFPEEIALSILAEMISARHGQPGV